MGHERKMKGSRRVVFWCVFFNYPCLREKKRVKEERGCSTEGNVHDEGGSK